MSAAVYIGTLAFIGLNGTASCDPRIASGGFAGHYSSGQCTGCIAFTPLSSSLGPVNCVLGDASRVMPGTGTAVFAPAGGPLTNTTGNAAGNFATRGVDLRNLGFNDVVVVACAGLAVDTRRGAASEAAGATPGELVVCGGDGSSGPTRGAWAGVQGAWWMPVPVRPSADGAGRAQRRSAAGVAGRAA